MVKVLGQLQALDSRSFVEILRISDAARSFARRLPRVQGSVTSINYP